MDVEYSKTTSTISPETLTFLSSSDKVPTGVTQTPEVVSFLVSTLEHAKNNVDSKMVSINFIKNLLSKDYYMVTRMSILDLLFIVEYKLKYGSNK